MDHYYDSSDGEVVLTARMNYNRYLTRLLIKEVSLHSYLNRVVLESDRLINNIPIFLDA